MEKTIHLFSQALQLAEQQVADKLEAADMDDGLAITQIDRELAIIFFSLYDPLRWKVAVAVHVSVIVPVKFRVTLCRTSRRALHLGKRQFQGMIQCALRLALMPAFALGDFGLIHLAFAVNGLAILFVSSTIITVAYNRHR